MRLNRRGFSLLEVIVAMSVLMILGTVAVVSYGKVQLLRLETKTAERLNDLARASVDFWNKTGHMAGSLDELSTFSGTPSVDAWGNPIGYYKDVVEVESGVVCRVLLISMGSNGQLDSTVQFGSFTASERDIWRCVSPYEFERTERSKTLKTLRRARTALSLYLENISPPNSACTQENSSTCPSVLVGLGYLEGTDGYDAWGRPFVIMGGTFVSAGPDGIAGTADDVQ